jgi:hypothetical protein
LATVSDAGVTARSVVDIRDFTPFAEANTVEDTVARLNAL